MSPASYAVSAAIGAALFVLIGYAVYALPGDGVWSFEYWLREPIRRSVHLWAMFGAVVGIGLRYVAATR